MMLANLSCLLQQKQQKQLWDPGQMMRFAIQSYHAYSKLVMACRHRHLDCKHLLWCRHMSPHHVELAAFAVFSGQVHANLETFCG